MPSFRIYCRAEDLRILWGEHIEAASLDMAIALARQSCRQRAQAHHIEVWQGAQRLYPPVTEEVATGNPLRP